ncbi:hypothetical protein NHG32_08250 [Aerococcaceae bacterium NML191219]|nr:hypothetical protein [Aerococcaceae bacterium NML191219]
MTLNELTLKVQNELTQEDAALIEVGDTIYLITEGNGFLLDTEIKNNCSAIELLFISMTYTLDELKQLITSAIYRAELSM